MVTVFWDRYSDHVFVIVLFTFVFGWVVLVSNGKSTEDCDILPIIVLS